jgi:hypothetical protein
MEMLSNKKESGNWTPRIREAANYNQLPTLGVHNSVANSNVGVITSKKPTSRNSKVQHLYFKSSEQLAGHYTPRPTVVLPKLKI